MSERGSEISQLAKALEKHVHLSMQAQSQIDNLTTQIQSQIDKLSQGQDKLNENMTELIKINIEDRARQEKHIEDKERLERNQFDLGRDVKEIVKKQNSLINTMILIEERQSNSTGKWDKVSDTGHKVLLWFLIAAIAILFGVKK